MKSILEEAQEITTNNRQSDYGHPSEDFDATAKIWNVIIKRRHKINIELTAEDVALMMIGLKLSRECNKHKRDNRVDMIGYVNTLEMVLDNKENDKKEKKIDFLLSIPKDERWSFIVYLNTEKTHINQSFLTFEEIVNMVGKNVKKDEYNWKITYKYLGFSEFSTLLEKQHVEIREEMTIDCSPIVYTIYFNGVEHQWSFNYITYDQIVKMYCKTNNLDYEKFKDTVFNITYSGDHIYILNSYQNNMIKISDGMNINCYITNKA